MARKKRYQYEENRDDDDFFVSRSQKKRDSTLLQEIGEEIVLLPQFKLDKLPLSEDLQIAIAEHKRLSNKEAKRRQLQYIGRLMRESQIEDNFENDQDGDNAQNLDLVSAYLEMKKGW